jgi:hypothetical protein
VYESQEIVWFLGAVMLWGLGVGEQALYLAFRMADGLRFFYSNFFSSSPQRVCGKKISVASWRCGAPAKLDFSNVSCHLTFGRLFRSILQHISRLSFSYFTSSFTSAAFLISCFSSYLTT